MSCPGGEVLAAYVAAELPALERRTAEAHLVRCRDCRARVLELRRAEARFAEGAGAPPAAPAEGGERGFALGLVIALAVVALALAALGRMGGASGSAAGVSPLGTSGAYGMLFDLVFFVRARAPGLLELVAALAATASVAAIAALGVASLARRIGPRLAVALVAGAAAAAAPAGAFEARGGHDAAVAVAVGETVAGSLAATGEEVRILGRVEGDLFVAAERVVIEGAVDGNVFAWARVLELRGRVGGSLHAGVKQLRIDGEIAGSCYVAVDSLSSAPGAHIGHDALGFGRRADWHGRIGRDLHFRGEELVLEGEVGRDLLAHAGRVGVGDGARIGRDLRAGVAHEGALEVAAGAWIGGARESAVTADEEVGSWLDSWLWVLVRVGAALAFGVALYALLPGLFRVRVPTLGSFVRLLGYGCATLVGVPIVLALIALTLVGLPLAVLGGFLYATALYLSHVLASAELGRALLRRPAAEDLPSLTSFARTLLVGLVAVALAREVPVLGPAVQVVILLVGLGLVAERVRAFTGSPRAADHGTFRARPAS